MAFCCFGAPEPSASPTRVATQQSQPAQPRAVPSAPVAALEQPQPAASVVDIKGTQQAPAPAAGPASTAAIPVGSASLPRISPSPAAKDEPLGTSGTSGVNIAVQNSGAQAVSGSAVPPWFSGSRHSGGEHSDLLNPSNTVTGGPENLTNVNDVLRLNLGEVGEAM